MTAQDQVIATTSDREIVLKRTVDAPRELVFEVWTDPKHLLQWWGPNGFTLTIREINVTVVWKDTGSVPSSPECR